MHIKKKFVVLIFSAFIFLLLFDAFLTTRNFKTSWNAVKVYDSSGALIYTKLQNISGYKTNIDINSLPDHIGKSVVSAEDKRFYKHAGIDIISLIRAVNANIRAGKIVSGGSTITQQVARDNLILNKGLLQNKYIRKIREINSAIALDILFSKDKILEKYLNDTYFGNRSYGIEEASVTYFNKPATQLSISEAALLAGSIKSPNSLNPAVQDEKVIQRRNEVLTLMSEVGYISEEELEEYKNLPLGFNPAKRKSEFFHFVEYVLAEARSELNIKDNEKLSGLNIYTTMNSNISSQSQKAARDHVDVLSEKHNLTNASVVVIDVDSGGVLAMIGSIDYFDKNIDGAVNVATSLRQPGSALKPITYAQAFYEGKLTPDTIIKDEKTTFIDRSGKSFVPYNYNGVFNGDVTARVALASSLNLPAVKVLEMVGVEDMIDTSQKLGLQSLNDPERFDLSVTLGGGEVTLLDLTNAYASFSRLGKYKPVYSINSIEDNSGKIIYEYEESVGVSVWGDQSEQVTRTIYDILSDPSDKVLGFGRNNVLILPFKAASKTGTTTDWHDNWTVGYTMDTPSDYVVGVWVGNSDHSPMYQLDGVTGAGPIWREVMLYTYNELISPYLLQGDTKNPDMTKDVYYDEIPSDQKVEKKDFQITNPPHTTRYYSLPHETRFERIKMETNAVPGMYSVEYILNGESLGTYYDEDNFIHLWNPIKGTYTLEAVVRNSEGEIIGRSSSDFEVYKEES